MFLNKITQRNCLIFRESKNILKIPYKTSKSFHQCSSQALNLFLEKSHTDVYKFKKINVEINKLNSLTSICRFYSTPNAPENANKPSNEDKTEPPKKSLYQRIKEMYRDYWYVLVPVHVATSICWFGGFYYLAKSGIDIIQFLEYLKVSESLINPLRDSSAGFVAISYALYKIFTPLRYTVTIGGTTVLINYLKEVGYIKPLPPKERIKEMMKEKQENFLEKKGQIMDSVRERRDNLKGTKVNIMRSVKEKNYIKNKKKC